MPAHETKLDATSRFSARAADYRAARPSYPAAAVDFVLEGFARPLRVADIGAGTGISARLLAARGADVIAIEPNAAMRAAAEPAPGVRYVTSNAEATGLPTAAVDLATVFQAFHWFATDAALAEIVRIVRPGGRAALVLNERDERDACTAAYGSLVRRFATDDTETLRQTSIAVFKSLPGPLAQRSFAQLQALDSVGLQQRSASTSYLPRDGEAAQRLRAKQAEIFGRYAVDGRIAIALTTLVVRIDLHHAR